MTSLNNRELPKLLHNLKTSVTDISSTKDIDHFLIEFSPLYYNKLQFYVVCIFS